ncbi:MAG: 16S rRNA (cytidine(1402)-2'-O)-methyltransferase [Candidatus Zixiibacteriota bacterium]|nr:MAG: 16S rRNA (cytidine(1402)-2'-O)-methyltransferase [candidate division Zixibacteria bacterium]
MSKPKGKIYLVPTPIGNMGDITGRAVEVLSEVDIVACEDTRHSGSLLKKLGLKKKLISYHNFNEAGRARQLMSNVLDGTSIAVITDGGSPGISDPAYRIVRTAIDNQVEIVPLPGPTALIPALTASGLPTDRFFFEGFLPAKKAARRKRLEQLRPLEHTLVFYESPHRISKTLHDIGEILGQREMCLAREISKKFEEFLRGKTADVVNMLGEKPIKGEIVLIVEGNRE